MLQNIALGGMMIALPIYFQMVFEYTAMQTGLALAPFSLSIFCDRPAGGTQSRQAQPKPHHPGRIWDPARWGSCF